MSYSGLAQFIRRLEAENELHVIDTFVDTEFEITDITDRVVKASGRALLFTNNGSQFSVLINAYGSDKRMLLALGRSSYDDAGTEMETLFNSLTGDSHSVFGKLKLLPGILGLASYFPSRSKGRGQCHEVVDMNPDLGTLPVLKCWPCDGGRFVTLPMVHTVHPATGNVNVGMYRMQVIDKNTTAMHWQRHKTGASHYTAWKNENRRMPVSVALGGDPVYAWSASAPLPENINEYILAGFMRKKKVRLVKCITNDLYVPEDADFVLEGYVDTSEELFMEGPFGDHTGFYSLPGLYPRFHVTCITRRKDAVYPATIVGVPPQEDTWFAKAAERVFLAPIKMAIQPEIIDFHMPDAGVAHNLLIVKIRKNYPGQGMKTVASLLGAGQMMFTKFIIAVNGNVDIRNYDELARHIFAHTSFGCDIMFIRGPLDALDHASDTSSFGGKIGIDATVKMDEETPLSQQIFQPAGTQFCLEIERMVSDGIAVSVGLEALEKDIPVAIFSVDAAGNPNAAETLAERLNTDAITGSVRLAIAVDSAIAPNDIYTVAWHALGNTDPLRDHKLIGANTLFINGTTKALRPEGFPRQWPNAVSSSADTIKAVDHKWSSLSLGSFLPSPSLRLTPLKHGEQADLPSTPV